MTRLILPALALLLACSAEPEPTNTQQASEPDQEETSGTNPNTNTTRAEPAADPHDPETWTLDSQDLPSFAASNSDSLRMGYFHGGRNMLLYRAMDAGDFREAELDVSFWSVREEGDPVFYRMPESIDHLVHIRKKRPRAENFGRTTGPQITAEMTNGRLHCGMIGESTFLTAIDQGPPWHAIARLGQDTQAAPGKVVVVRKGLVLEEPADFEGLSVGSRQSGPYDMVMVREWLLHEGVPLRSVSLKDQIPQTKLKRMLRKQQLDIAFLHLHIGGKMVEKGKYERYPGFDFSFADPELSQALLVCHDDVIRDRREELVDFLEVYKHRIDYENGLSEEERAAHTGDKARGMDLDTFEDLNLPQYRSRPVIELRTLEAMQALLVKHHIVDSAKPIAPYLDNSLMEQALARVATSQGLAGPDRSTATKRLMAVLSTDGDMALSRAEFEATAHDSSLFEGWDLDMDGSIGLAELQLGLLAEDPMLPHYRGNVGKHPGAVKARPPSME